MTDYPPFVDGTVTFPAILGAPLSFSGRVYRRKTKKGGSYTQTSRILDHLTNTQTALYCVDFPSEVIYCPVRIHAEGAGSATPSLLELSPGPAMIAGVRSFITPSHFPRLPIENTNF